MAVVEAYIRRGGVMRTRKPGRLACPLAPRGSKPRKSRIEGGEAFNHLLAVRRTSLRTVK